MFRLQGIIFWFGIGFIICSVFLLVMLLKSLRKPKISAQINDIKPNMINAKFGDANVSYTYNNGVEQTIVTLKGKYKVGDSILITQDANGKFAEFLPKKDIRFIIIFFLVGLGLILPGILINVL